MDTTEQTGASFSVLAARIRHTCGGAFVLAGWLLAVLSIVAATHGLHGYLDIASFLGSLFLAAAIVRLGWAWST